MKKSGGVWIGLCGFFNHKSSLKNAKGHCHDALCFTSSVAALAAIKGWKLNYAIDHGQVVGGFISGYPHFGILGSEVRWVIEKVNIAHSFLSNKIIVSHSVRSSNLSSKPGSVCAYI